MRLLKTRTITSSVTSCLKDGSIKCDTTTGECPPCIYALENTYTCWKKDNSTNTCPFTGVRYDCSDSWSSTTTISSETPSDPAIDTSSSTTVSSPSSSSLSGISADASSSSIAIGRLSSSLITYGAISFGAFLVLVILVVLCARRRKMRYRREEDIAATEAGNFGRNRTSSDRRLRGLMKARDDTLSGPYNNVLDTSKVNYAVPSVNPKHGKRYGGQHKGSHIDDSLSRVPTDESPRSFDGMLADSSDSPAFLGKKTSSQRSGGHSAQATPIVQGIGKYSDVSNYVHQDVSFRCTSTPDVFGEYLRMKQEMHFDESGGNNMGRRKSLSFSDISSDLGSSKSSFESSGGTSQLPQRRLDQDGRFSMADSITDSIADSVTDSEYAEQLRTRGESDCFSEMSYNDERYSFSSVEGLDDSQVRESKREVEI
ncbi:unnamed protein product [Peronospora belbahrii]|uniref:Uncharacterized protein n=1 Tax=Peronospora belbahrii TaxID=622444 RepID=A0AAU9L5W6_9STRA|nr:unnamed protein product [Peronospora belbahrii]CAH0521407.1 unnamed protein product [Peronospora belbahrii]